MDTVSYLNTTIKICKQKAAVLTNISLNLLGTYLLFSIILFGTFLLGFLFGWLAYQMSHTNYFTSLFCAFDGMLLFICTDMLLELLPTGFHENE